jgi:hypothetical protein
MPVPPGARRGSGNVAGQIVHRLDVVAVWHLGHGQTLRPGDLQPGVQVIPQRQHAQPHDPQAASDFLALPLPSGALMII